MGMCEFCNQPFERGDWPICDDGTGKHGHSKPKGMMTFKPYIDWNAGDTPVEVTSWKERQNLFKPKWNGDHIEQIVPRDLPDSHYREAAQRREHRLQEA